MLEGRWEAEGKTREECEDLRVGGNENKREIKRKERKEGTTEDEEVI